MKRINLYISLFYILITLSVISTIFSFSSTGSDFNFRMAPEDSATQVQKDIYQSTTSFFFPQSNRNPFLSPMDYEKIIKEEEEKRKKEELLKKIEQEAKNNTGYNTRDDSILKNIKLQGIVGKYAIINGDMVQEGSYYRKKILIEKVQSGYVIISYKGKKYRLVMK